MLDKALHYLQSMRALQRMNLALSRAATTSLLRKIQEDKPVSWQFSGFSQNGEDGITDFLCNELNSSNRYFVEIGAADGLENNTAWLAIAKKYSGIMIEGDKKLAARLKSTIPALNLGVEILDYFVTLQNISQILADFQFLDPDVFSLDIDGNDYHILKALLARQFRPKIIIVEYNSAFGPDNCLTIPYQENFNYQVADKSGLYYGVSLAAWHKLLSGYHYHFVTVESNGVNAFFIDPQCFSDSFVQSLMGLAFAENFYQRKKFKRLWQDQFTLFQHLPLEVPV